MINFKKLISKEKIQFQIYIGLSFIVYSLTAILHFFDSQMFQRFIAVKNPLLACGIIIITGFVLLSFLLSKNWFVIYNKSNFKKGLYAALLALLFVPVSILVDIQVGFRKDLNVLFPKSLLFYPAIGFIVEILFHVLPLTLLLFLLTSIFKNLNQQKVIWAAIVIVSLLEPVYQTRLMFSSSHFPLWSSVLVLLNLIAFNLTQLHLFKRYDFVTMYSFRLIYYLTWHIVWGYFRLEWLF